MNVKQPCNNLKLPEDKLKSQNDIQLIIEIVGTSDVILIIYRY